MASSPRFLQVLAKCATAQAELNKLLADAHAREVAELHSQIEAAQAQGVDHSRRQSYTPPSMNFPGYQRSSEKEDTDVVTEVIAVRSAEAQDRSSVCSSLLDEPLPPVAAPCPPANVMPSSPSVWNQPPLLGVVPSEEPPTKTHSFQIDYPPVHESENSADSKQSKKVQIKRQGTGGAALVADNAAKRSKDDSPDGSEKSEEYESNAKDLLVLKDVPSTNGRLSPSPQGAWEASAANLVVQMHPGLAQSRASSRGSRRISWRDMQGLPGMGGGPMPNGRQSARASLAGSARPSIRGSLIHMPPAGSARNSYVDPQTFVDPLSPQIDADGHADAWPLWHNVLEAIQTEQLAKVEAGDCPAKPTRTQKVKHKLFSSARTRKLKNLKSRDLHLRENTSHVFLSILQAMAIHPSGTKRLFWLFLSLLFIMYDIVMVPLSSFDLDIEEFMLVMTWIIAIYWQLNLVASFFFGYHENFTVELRFRKTALRYAKTWLPLDLTLVVLDWVLLIDHHIRGADEYSGNEARTARAAKGFYIARALRVLRLARAAHLPANIRETAFLFTRSQYMSLTIGIVKHMLSILIINHVIACFWYMLGKESGWVPFYMDDIEQGDNWEMKYLTSLHWSLTQFTPASMTVQPRNLKERAFAVAVLLFALVSFSSFVSSITNLMNHLRTLKSAEAKQFSQLERYFHDHNISFGLSLRVRRYLEHVLSENKRRPQEGDVEMLAKLSEPLRMEIHQEVFSPTLVKHPFFAHYQEFNLQAMRKLCHTALKTLRLSTDDVLFNSGETAKAMYFVISGHFDYSRPGRIEAVNPGEWICEMILWRPWEHQGKAWAATESSVMALDAGNFHQIIIDTKSVNRVAEEDSCNYALQAVKILGEKNREDLTDLDDGLEARAVAMETFTEVVAMPEMGGKHHHLHFNVFDMLHRNRNRQSLESNRGSACRNSRRESKPFEFCQTHVTSCVGEVSREAAGFSPSGSSTVSPET